MASYLATPSATRAVLERHGLLLKHRLGQNFLVNDAIIEKIITGGLNKYFKEICLMQQPFVKDDKVSVEQHIAAVAKEVGADVKLVGYTRFEKGEGLQKKEENFAEEIAKMVK